MKEDTYELEPDDDRSGASQHAPAIRCRSCSSPLTIAPRDGICPECDCPVAGPESIGKSAEDDPTPEGWKTSTKIGGKALPPKCEGCGYDLRGHGASAKCPECGLPRRPRSKSEAIDPLYLMPREIIVTFRNGAIAVMGCLAAAPVAIILLIALGADQTLFALTLLCLTLAWVICVWQFTPAFEFRQAVRRGFSSAGKLRRAARWMQFAWPAAALMYMLTIIFSGAGAVPVGLLYIGILTFVLLGLAGLIVLSLLFEELADWSCDDTAERFFRGSQWGIAFSGLILVFAVLAEVIMPNALITAILRIASFFAALILLGSIATYLYALLSLSRSVTLSLYHAKEYQERTRRREKRLREQEEREERLRQQAAPR